MGFFHFSSKEERLTARKKRERFAQEHASLDESKLRRQLKTARLRSQLDKQIRQGGNRFSAFGEAAENIGDLGAFSQSRRKRKR